MGIHHQGPLMYIDNYCGGEKYAKCLACEGDGILMFTATDKSFPEFTLVEESCQSCGGEGYVPLLPLPVRMAYFLYYKWIGIKIYIRDLKQTTNRGRKII